MMSSPVDWPVQAFAAWSWVVNLRLPGHDVTIVAIGSSQTSFEGMQIVGPVSASGIDALAKSMMQY